MMVVAASRGGAGSLLVWGERGSDRAGAWGVGVGHHIREVY